MRPFLASLVLCTALAAPRSADGFCGFYVSGGGADLFNNATQVVLMRMGTRTVLSMQNTYQGPPEDFAMVIPVPEVLQQENVKTLDAKVFARVDKLSAPRLVEYWERDPCTPEIRTDPNTVGVLDSFDDDDDDDEDGGELGVTVEARFKVGEYQIVILSAKESTGLDTWLRQERYNIPGGAEPLLRPYVQSGMKFFVAKVDATKVAFRGGMAQLSPLRFHYDSPDFRLPIRLGLMNSSGTQDLIVHVLAPGQRYQLANYENASIPTNLDVRDQVRTRFGEFYAALFDATLGQNPGAVITEYAWDASTCDPCPEPPLAPVELATLGADALSGDVGAPSPYRGSFVLTRLHARYGKDGAPDDLVFQAAPPIVGGREMRRQDGSLEVGAKGGNYNNFQGRYAIRHEWTGPITCENPQRGVWGGPPRGVPEPAIQPAVELAFAPRGQTSLAAMVTGRIPGLAMPAATGARPPTPPASTAPPLPTGGPPKSNKGGCGCTASSTPLSDLATAGMAGLFLLLLGRRRMATNACPRPERRRCDR